jgi:muramoyltetrapeptide carboxypeptidase
LNPASVTLPTVPPALHPEDLIAIAAPAGPVNPEDLQRGTAILENSFYILKEPRLTERCGFLAGTDATRTSVLQRAIDHPEVKAVVAARGGYGTTRIVDQLNIDNLIRNPRWIAGSSDLTALLMHLWEKLQLVTIHGPMVARFVHGHREDVVALSQLLLGHPWDPPEGLDGVVPGYGEGPFIGGNLCTLAHLAGNLSAHAFHRAVLFIEDVAEAPYRIDRMLTQLKRAGFLQNLSGVVVGDFTRCDPASDGVTAREVIREHLFPLNIPIAENYPAAHGDRNYPFLHGGKVSLCVEKDGGVNLQTVREQT